MRDVRHAGPVYRPRRTPRTWMLTDKGREAIGLPVYVLVPLVKLPHRPDHKDRRDD